MARKPITIGIIIDAVPPMKLNVPPAIPISRFGANNETNTQVIEAEPFPKKAIMKAYVLEKNTSFRTKEIYRGE
ncbi:hypothetical protein [Peribacillus frigoritolerans]|uniref:hypothetical protein n=1 Tax=Peribacillus frigoritolerans TaxID=450367 RepID=UPI003305C39E